MALAALLSFASSFMYGALARRAVIGRLPGTLGSETLEGLNAAWLCGAAAMVTLGVLALSVLGGLGRGRGAERVPLVAGLFFLGYGVWGYVYRHFHPHFVGFMVIGALFIAGVCVTAWNRVTS